jgi:aldehyde dehydrogenase (NAD(P)+)
VEQIDRDLQTLDAAKDAWAWLPIERKIALLEGLKRSVHALAPEWVSLASQAKGLQPGSALAGEEWISGPWAVLYALTRYVRTLRGISARGESPVPRPRMRADGRTVVDVFPRTIYDRLLLSGVSAQVWMQCGIKPDDVRREAAAFYHSANQLGRVAVVLGAGNIASIAPLDVLYKLIAEGSVCMLKMNPVNEYLGPVFERAFAQFVDGGYLRFAYGGGDVGAYLCTHDLVQEIHITGSEATHRAIVANAGTGKRITSELGNVSPTIVIPGPWSVDDLAFQAENIATQKAHNAGFNCIAAQVLVLPKEWEHSRGLHDGVTRVFDTMEQRPEYYPGAMERRANFAGDRPQLRTIVSADPQRIDDPAFSTEAFCGVLASTELPGTLENYVRDAVAFANERLHGTLGANIIVHPETMKTHAPLIDEAIAELRYGCVAVNGWTGIGYFIAETPWGAYPGHTLENAGSGLGVVHNSYLLEHTEKSVVYAPFAPFPRSVRGGQFTFLPRPPWFVTNAMQAQIGRALCDFELAPSPGRAMHIASLAMRG